MFSFKKEKHTCAHCGTTTEDEVEFIGHWLVLEYPSKRPLVRVKAELCREACAKGLLDGIKFTKEEHE